jgi:lysozyme
MNKVTPMAIDICRDCATRVAEGIRLKPYLCSAGVPTIGIGTTIYPNGTRVTMLDKEITVEQANEYFDYYIQNHAIPVLELLLLQRTDMQNGALLSLIYNIGATAFKTSTLFRVLNEANPDNEVIKNAFLMWNKATVKGKKQVVKGLHDRREWESQVYLARIGELFKPNSTDYSVTDVN